MTADEKPQRRVTEVTRQRNIAVLTACVLLLALLLNGAWQQACSPRTVMVPTRANADGWVDTSARASASYLAEYARDVADALYTRKPSAAAEQNDALYRMVCTRLYASVKAQMESPEQIELAKQRDMFTIHFPERVKVEPGTNSVEILTRLETYIGDRRANSEKLRLTLTFEDDGGALKWCGYHEEAVQ